jgi:hypothetical protein
LPTTINGKLLTFEEVVLLLDRETVSYKSSIGVDGKAFDSGPYSQYIFISIKVEVISEFFNLESKI